MTKPTGTRRRQEGDDALRRHPKRLSASAHRLHRSTELPDVATAALQQQHQAWTDYARIELRALQTREPAALAQLLTRLDRHGCELRVVRSDVDKYPKDVWVRTRPARPIGLGWPELGAAPGTPSGAGEQKPARRHPGGALVGLALAGVRHRPRLSLPFPFCRALFPSVTPLTPLFPQPRCGAEARRSCRSWALCSWRRGTPSCCRRRTARRGASPRPAARFCSRCRPWTATSHARSTCAASSSLVTLPSTGGARRAVLSK